MVFNIHNQIVGRQLFQENPLLFSPIFILIGLGAVIFGVLGIRRYILLYKKTQVENKAVKKWMVFGMFSSSLFALVGVFFITFGISILF